MMTRSVQTGEIPSRPELERIFLTTYRTVLVWSADVYKSADVSKNGKLFTVTTDISNTRFVIRMCTLRITHLIRTVIFKIQICCA